MDSDIPGRAVQEPTSLPAGVLQGRIASTNVGRTVEAPIRYHEPAPIHGNEVSIDIGRSVPWTQQAFDAVPYYPPLHSIPHPFAQSPQIQQPCAPTPAIPQPCTPPPQSMPYQTAYHSGHQSGYQFGYQFGYQSCICPAQPSYQTNPSYAYSGYGEPATIGSLASTLTLANSDDLQPLEHFLDTTGARVSASKAPHPADPAGGTTVSSTTQETLARGGRGGVTGAGTPQDPARAEAVSLAAGRRTAP